MENWLAPLITGFSSVAVALITVWLKSYLDTKKEETKLKIDEGIQSDDLGEMVFIHEYIESMRVQYDFDRVSICQFHNGGKFFNGKSMKKFSMTYEAASPGYEKVKRAFQNVLVSEFPVIIQKMVTEDIIISSVADSTDSAFRRDMEMNGIKQNIKIPIRGLKGGLAGFIMCHNISKIAIVTDDMKESLIQQADQLSGYIIK